MTRFNSLSLAYSFADRSIKAHVVVMIENGQYGVVTFAEGQRMVKAGYELAERP